MNVKTKCVIAENIGEALIGGAVGICLNKTIIPKCNKFETLVVIGGAAIGAGIVGNKFGKGFYKFCNDVFDTDFMVE